MVRETKEQTLTNINIGVEYSWVEGVRCDRDPIDHHLNQIDLHMLLHLYTKETGS